MAEAPCSAMLTEAELRNCILYQDDHIIILNKPPGIPVHRGFGPLIALDHYFPLLQKNHPRPPALGHRLDKDTSGCLVLGRHKEALRILGILFSKNLVKKTYWAWVQGHPPHPQGRIDLPLAAQSERSGFLAYAAGCSG
jgi:tRNA pseudouridine32 synthase/23S rRNA pseudouridine746 synthase